MSYGEMDAVDKILSKYGLEISKKLVEDIKSKPVTKFGSVNASGKLANSINFIVQDGKLQVKGLDYIYYLEKGRGPTKKKGDKPLRVIIEQWIVDKGIISDISTKSLAFLIARKIHREGTDIYQQGGSDLVSGILTDKLLGEIKSDLILLFTGIVVREMKSTITGISR